MSFVNDKLYKGYLRQNLPTIVSTVKVREIVPHLPCLTDHDKENIEAKREIYGNHDSMVLLLDCLKRRQNWPEQFIEALEACDYPTIAADVRREYNALRGITNSSSSSPPTVTQAHVHPEPSASHVSSPGSVTNSEDLPPAEAPAPTDQASPPLETTVQTQDPQSSPAPAPDPVPELPQSAQVETRPPAPVTPYNEVLTTPPPQMVAVNTHQEPEENSESVILDITGDNGGLPDEVTAGNAETLISSADTLQPTGPAEQNEAVSPSCQDLLQPTAITPELRSPQTPSPAGTNSGVTNESSSLMVTPEKPPVQDTTPPVDVILPAVLHPEETSEPAATQVVESGPQTDAAPTATPFPGAAGINAPVFDDSSVYLSKPGELITIQSQENGCPSNPAPDSPVEPYSGDTGRLELSAAAVTSAHVPACSAVNSPTLNANIAQPCYENGIALNHNDPQENHYESPCQSFDSQEVQMNVVQISEEPSILNLDGQSSTPHPQIVNSEAAMEAACAPLLAANDADTVGIINSPSCENHLPSEPAPAAISIKTLQDTKEASSHHLTAKTKYILTAAGVGACALLMAWKFKH
ncbi:mitochondrial antiviral-signaling protein [Antennarius striatus]|uniref:mitochondrial antiviral-signaling protein n=1 Tax=Antennarius striatus TaxID=241820 RepID=UPI0035B4EB1D